MKNTFDAYLASKLCSDSTTMGCFNVNKLSIITRSPDLQFTA